MKKTVKAIERISEIRQRRQERFYEKRMAKVKVQQAAQDKQQLEQEIHLVKAPASLVSDKAKQKSKEKLKVAVEQQQQQVDAMQE